MGNELEVVTQLIAVSDISKAFGLDVATFLTVVLGSFIVGSICLTFHYKIYDNNKLWANLEIFEKAIVSSVIGFFSILASLYLFTLFQLIFAKDKELEYVFNQLNYIAPFLYFICFSTLAARYNYIELDFIKIYIQRSFTFIAVLVFIIIFIILFFAEAWTGILWLILLILIIIAPFIYQMYLSSSSAKNKK